MRIGRTAEATTIAHPPLAAVGLIGLVARPLCGEIGLQPLERQQQPLDARARNRVRVIPTMLLELPLSLRQPPASPTTRVGDVATVELELRRRPGLRRRLRLGSPDLLRILALPSTAELPPRLAEELPPPLRRAQLLGQLITTRLAELLILGLIGRPDLAHNLERDLLELKVDIRIGVPRDPGAIDRHHPDFTKPALWQSFNTSVNSPASARWWRQMNRATVTWSGTRLPVITRNATFSRQ